MNKAVLKFNKIIYCRIKFCCHFFYNAFKMHKKLTPFFFSYTISKTGLYTLTKTTAMSLAPKIRVNGIAPGPTIKNKRQSDKHFKKQYLATPLRKQVDVNEICNAVDFFIKNFSCSCLKEFLLLFFVSFFIHFSTRSMFYIKFISFTTVCFLSS